MTMWLGKGRSFLCYPVSSGRLINMVAFVPTNLESEESWTAPGDLKALAAEYAGWEIPYWTQSALSIRRFAGAAMIERPCRTGQPGG
jgi:hypothetical protein